MKRDSFARGAPQSAILALVAVWMVATPFASASGEPLELRRGDHVAIIGNTLADRMQHEAWLETFIHALHPEHDLTFRNLGYAGDELKTRPREESFGSPDEWLTKVGADVVFCFFGRNEALKGEAGLAGFRKDLADVIDGMLAQNYGGDGAPRLVFFSPIAHEDLKSPHLPDGSVQNASLALYTAAMEAVCREKVVRFVDIFTPTRALYARSAKPLTLNGVHLEPHGERALAEVIVRALFAKEPPAVGPEIEKLRTVVADKNHHWFSRYRVVDGYNVFGGRSRLAWFGQSNADVMQREMENFDIKTANRDRRVWALARGGDLEVKDDNLLPDLEVRPNKEGPLEAGRFPYLGGEEAIAKMDVHEGMKVNLFASEEMFPRLINPVQMAVDTDSRLWVAVWPSYPHWNPREPRTDAILILPDENHDGVADDCIVFADKLNSVTGFEFWGGGVLVAALPEIWFLQDTDGDDKADRKVRMLQGVSSADTHHSANAMVVGPDGWLYWSRGIFNIANFETPTGVYRSGESGVHRFNPRTFEVEFHFPIGPNPHGDAFDQWGYQFATDGTGGTGSYINIGKGVGNKQWYRMRVRPVPAIGFLSSTHFPEEQQGNFLIANSIGVLGVLQHEVKYSGANITAEEIDPILLSSDPNFRPSDIEIGGDGALYVSDWHNILIGHMQHNMRDPNRDRTHGRVYRVTAEGRPLLEPVKMRGRPIGEVARRFFSRENSTRYRARLELSGRKTDEIVKELSAFAANLDVSKPADAQALLECSWVFEEHRVPNGKLLATVFRAAEPRVRAAAIRTLGHMGSRVEAWEKLLIEAARDDAALVRAEAVKAAVSFPGLLSAEVIFEVATRPTDPELDTVLAYAKRQIDVDALVADALRTGTDLSSAARAYVLSNASVDDLLRFERTPEVYQAILARPNIAIEPLREALGGLAKARGVTASELLVDLIETRDEDGENESIGNLAQLLESSAPGDELRALRRRIERLATEGRAPRTRRAAWAAWISADGSGDAAFLAASQSRNRLQELLTTVPEIADEKLRGELFDDVRSFVFELPPSLSADVPDSLAQNGIKVDFFFPSAENVAIETLDRMTPRASGVVSAIIKDVPQKRRNDRFALRFTGMVHAPATGKYTFSTTSDDGSRFYLGGRLLVNNDGLHGMVKKSGSADLSAGLHPIVVTYFDNGGDDGLAVTWSGPGFAEESIPASRLFISGGESIHDLAIRALSSIPGHEDEKVADIVRLIKAGRSRAAAVRALREIPEKHWPAAEAPDLVDNLIGYASSFPASARTGGPASDAMALAESLAAKLPAEAARAAKERLGNLDVRVIAIGTVRERMIYDKEEIAVQAGKPVEFRFSNSDNMPHNFSIVEPGALVEIGELAEATGSQPDAAARQYVPKSEKVLLSSRLLGPGERQTLTFDVPTSPGVYPYVCTYPGHWRRMYGALYVVADLEAYLADPEGYLAANPLPLRDEMLRFSGRNTEWKYEDLIRVADPLPHERSFEVGKNVFQAASCVSCHKIGEQGIVFGPDLTALAPEKQTIAHILRSIIEPSAVIDEKFRSHAFVLSSGEVITGMIVEESADQLKVLVDPLAKAAPVVVKKASIIARELSESSIMPQGLVSKLTQEEILDLLAFIYARGDAKHHLFGKHGDHHDK
jgi:putative heme-binding domain-containing protein